MSLSLPTNQGVSWVVRGRGSYQNKDYKSALKAFDQAVGESTEFMLLQALECRAATYEKLGDLQSALKDSRRMITLKPEASKGYLRCGKVLQLKGENELALKIYERGLSKVKIGNDDQRPLLQKTYNKLFTAQNPGKILDPLHFLPLELAQMVCQFLRMRDKVVCLAVSKSWKKLLESMHKLWMTLDTTSARKAVGFTSLKAYLRRSNYTLEHAIISSKAGFDSTKLQFVTEKCKRLKTLEMRGTGILSSSLDAALPHARQLESLKTGSNMRTTIATVGRAIEAARKTIVSATFLDVVATNVVHSGAHFRHTTERLRELELRSNDGGVSMDLSNMQTTMPNLTHLTLHNIALGGSMTVIDLSGFAHLEDLILSDIRNDWVPKFPLSIKHIQLFKNHSMRSITPGQRTKLPLLESLSILHCSKLNSAALFDMVNMSECGLKYLDVGGKLFESSMNIRENFPASNTIEHLGLSMIANIKDKELKAIVDLYPNLQRIDLESTSISGVGLKYLVEKKLTSISVDHCANLGEDAVVWARAQGVTVSHRMIRPQQQQQQQRYRDVLADQYY